MFNNLLTSVYQYGSKKRYENNSQISYYDKDECCSRMQKILINKISFRFKKTIYTQKEFDNRFFIIYVYIFQ